MPTCNDCVCGALGGVFCRRKKDIFMKISDNGRNLLIVNEGKKLTPYPCSRGVPTIGIGCTTYQDGRKVTLKDRPITEKECTDLFNHHIAHAEKWLNNNCKWTNQNQYDALCSFLHQYHIEKYPNTKKAFISGNLPEIRRILTNDFNHADVSKRDGTLKARRQRELTLFNKVA